MTSNAEIDTARNRTRCTVDNRSTTELKASTADTRPARHRTGLIHPAEQTKKLRWFYNDVRPENRKKRSQILSFLTLGLCG